MVKLPVTGARELPARSIPVPETVSPQMQKLIAMPPAARLDPKTPAEWRAAVQARAAATLQSLPALRRALGVTVTPQVIDGVAVHAVTPGDLPAANRNRLLLHMHGGCYVFSPGEAGTAEAIYMAGFGRCKVISVDYRMPPDHPYPAALDDGMTVWRALTRTMAPRNMAIFGASAGGALTLAMVLRARQERLSLPAAIAPGTPMSDLTNAGDTFRSNALLDNILVTSDTFCDQGAALYANGHDLRDPLLSPLYGDFSGFPPTILTSGTRDLLLSSTVRVHRKLRQAGVEAVLQVFEGQSHAQYFRDPEAPETREAFAEIAGFFDKHLGT